MLINLDILRILISFRTDLLSQMRKNIVSLQQECCEGGLLEDYLENVSHRSVDSAPGSEPVIFSSQLTMIECLHHCLVVRVGEELSVNIVNRNLVLSHQLHHPGHG